MMLEKYNEKSNHSVTVVSNKCAFVFEFSQKEPDNTENTAET